MFNGKSIVVYVLLLQTMLYTVIKYDIARSVVEEGSTTNYIAYLREIGLTHEAADKLLDC